MTGAEAVGMATGQQFNHPPEPRHDALVKPPVSRSQARWKLGMLRCKTNKSKEDISMATFSDLFSFFETPANKLLFAIGCFSAILHGLLQPILAYLLSATFSDMGNISDDMAVLRRVAYQFLILGAYAFVVATVQGSCLEAAASRATTNFRKRWFFALLRQDSAFFDMHDVAGLASSVESSATRFRRGLGRIGGGIQFGSTALAGVVYAFYSSWRVALVIIGALPLVIISGHAVMKFNQSQTARATQAYTAAGSCAYQTASSIRTVLSLNAAEEMIRRYKEATRDAFQNSVSSLWKQGLANGSMVGSVIMLYCILTLYGSFLLYRDIGSTGCDASAGVPGVPTCGESGPSVFGAMLGAAFAALGMSQVASVIEAVTAARTACAVAMVPIRRTLISPEAEAVMKVKDRVGSGDDHDDIHMEEGVVKNKKMLLPKYLIDSSHPGGLKPHNITGAISFKNVVFAYPNSPDNLVFEGFNLEIKAGTTIALVGPSGGGKSTTVGLVERFYDPSEGTVQLNGIDLKLYNVHYLRSLIGYVGQNPPLFATTIAGNIRYGKPNATKAEIEEAAKLANAHDFICSLPDGYETHVGDKGSQLSGGQKQRIAIARVLVGNPSVLILDEATSALDSESELLVQEALDKLLTEQKRTTIIIAHRLTTIRNADTIAVIAGGRVIEQGTHEELMASSRIGMYRNLVAKQEAPPSRSGSTLGVDGVGRRRESFVDLQLGDGGTRRSVYCAHQVKFKNVTFSYPTRKKKLIMDGFNLSVRKGETLALVGPSGGGKSTTVSLIERFYDPLEGAVDFEGIDVRDLDVTWLRDQIGFVEQLPILFDDSIAANISMGCKNATQREIIEAAKMAYCHDFISAFPEGYNTEVGERGIQLSGGQKQRIAIARALIKNPKVLLLDEATSALDTDSERIVQEALDNLTASRERTTIVIAHRLSTVRNADRIAFVADGKVREIGSHEELMERPMGRYKRLVESQKRRSTVDLISSIKGDPKTKVRGDDDEDKGGSYDGNELDEDGSKAFNSTRVRQMAMPDKKYLLVGVLGAIVAGGVFPAWGMMFGYMIELLFRQTLPCPSEDMSIPFAFDSCDEYYNSLSDDMQQKSYRLGIYWALIAVAFLIGNVVLFYGFGMAGERLNKRVRDSAFRALVRQEIAFFDRQSVGGITSQLQEDAAKIHALIGEPVRSLIMGLVSVVVGLIVCFVYMWPFALVALGTTPFIIFATFFEMKTLYGEDEDDSGDGTENVTSPGGIIVESLLNIRTVAALNMERQVYKDYVGALHKAEPRTVFNSIKSGGTSGLPVIIRQLCNALLFWWGGKLLLSYHGIFSYEDFLVSMFSIIFSFFALGSVITGVSDKEECKKAAGRIFYLLDRHSAIDPLSTTQ